MVVVYLCVGNSDGAAFLHSFTYSSDSTLLHDSCTQIWSEVDNVAVTQLCWCNEVLHAMRNSYLLAVVIVGLVDASGIIFSVVIIADGIYSCQIHNCSVCQLLQNAQLCYVND